MPAFHRDSPCRKHASHRAAHEAQQGWARELGAAQRELSEAETAHTEEWRRALATCSHGLRPRLVATCAAAEAAAAAVDAVDSAEEWAAFGRLAENLAHGAESPQPPPVGPSMSLVLKLGPVARRLPSLVGAASWSMHLAALTAGGWLHLFDRRALDDPTPSLSIGVRGSTLKEERRTDSPAVAAHRLVTATRHAAAASAGVVDASTLEPPVASVPALELRTAASGRFGGGSMRYVLTGGGEADTAEWGAALAAAIGGRSWEPMDGTGNPASEGGVRSAEATPAAPEMGIGGAKGSEDAMGVAAAALSEAAAKNVEVAEAGAEAAMKVKTMAQEGGLATAMAAAAEEVAEAAAAEAEAEIGTEEARASEAEVAETAEVVAEAKLMELIKAVEAAGTDAELQYTTAGQAEVVDIGEMSATYEGTPAGCTPPIPAPVIDAPATPSNDAARGRLPPRSSPPPSPPGEAGGGGEDVDACGELGTAAHTIGLAESAGPMLCLVRHSARLDEASSFAQIGDEQWADRFERPFDTPISDTELPRRTADALRAAGLEFDVLVSSPYRRCLQTAGILARTLGVTKIVVDNRLGEHVPAARRVARKLTGGDVGELCYVEHTEAARCAGVAKEQLLWRRDEHPVLTEPDDLVKRAAALPHVCANAVAHAGSAEARLLLVTHGDLINLFVPGFDWDPTVGRYQAQVCGWVACTGHEQLAAYEGDTVPLDTVPRVLATEGVEPM